MRMFLLCNLLGTLTVLGVFDIIKGNYKTGIAGVLLAIVNFLLFWR